MKRNYLFFKSVASLLLITSLYSCTKSKDNNSDQLATLGKATITGSITAKLVDTVGATNQQAVKAGIVIQAWIDTKDYVLNPLTGGTTYAKKYFSTTTNADGFYFINVDVSKYQPATVHIEASDFEAGVLKKDASNPPELYTERHVFKSGPISDIVVNDGQTVITDIRYY
jgi:hypothetical protein